jgi:4-diphosphocytidyl-2-C-methyl-D-erythritol kinase
MPLRADGFHPIESVFHGVSLADTIELEDTAEETSVTMTDAETGDEVRVSENLAGRAAAALARPGDPGTRIAIAKRIPLAAGMGGGSADAAGVLVALNDLRGLGHSRRRLAEIGLELGSDVPYFLSGGSLLVTGRGEHLEPIECSSDLHFVLGISSAPLSTGAVYRAWDDLGTTAEGGPDGMIEALKTGDPRAVADRLANDLEAAALALRPDLENRKAALIGAGGLGALVSGSGPTVFALAEDDAHARDIASRAADSFNRIEVVVSRPQAVMIER